MLDWRTYCINKYGEQAIHLILQAIQKANGRKRVIIKENTSFPDELKEVLRIFEKEMGLFKVQFISKKAAIFTF